MRAMVRSMSRTATRRAARRRKVTTSRANTTTISARKDRTRRDLTITMITVTSTKMVIPSTTGTRKNMERRADRTITRNGDTKKERVIKSSKLNLLM